MNTNLLADYKIVSLIQTRPNSKPTLPSWIKFACIWNYFSPLGESNPDAGKLIFNLVCNQAYNFLKIPLTDYTKGSEMIMIIPSVNHRFTFGLRIYQNIIDYCLFSEKLYSCGEKNNRLCSNAIQNLIFCSVVRFFEQP